MRYTPKKSKKGTNAAFLMLLFALLLTFIYSVNTIPYRGLIQIGALFFLGTGLFLLMRYTLTEYSYIVEGETFTVEKRNGKTVKTVCNLTLRTGIAVTSRPKTKEEKAEFQTRYGVTNGRFNFCASLSPEKCFILLLNFNGAKTELLFEPDDAFLDAVRAALEKAKEAQKAEEEAEEY